MCIQYKKPYLRSALAYRVIEILWNHSKKVCMVLMTMNDEDGNTPLHLACQHGRMDVVNKFITIIQDSEVPEITSR